jgi:anti-sigma-K factor RskA
MNNVDIHTLAGAYALDALDDIERAAFTRHMADCESCTTEVAELRETTTRLAAASAVTPPARLRAQVLEQVSRTRQLSPPVPAPRTTATASRSRRWLAAAAAGVLIAAGAAGATYAIQDHRVRVAQSQASESEQIKQVLGASDAKVASGQIDGGNVVVVTSAALDKSVVVVKSLPTPGSQAYQLWMAFGGEARSIGVLPAGASSAIRLIPDTNGASAFMISREPPGGSATPTTVVGQLTMA